MFSNKYSLYLIYRKSDMYTALRATTATFEEAQMESMAPETVVLCRCGGSTTKPFCNGTHAKIGFRVAHRAIRQEEEWV
jgi:CDGSH-type Zn-finger protein